MHSDTHADRPLGERLLHLRRSRDRIRRARERVEERVALGVDLNAAVTIERVTERAAVLRQHVRVPVAELVQQPR
jgi:hypothetical protein